MQLDLLNITGVPVFFNRNMDWKEWFYWQGKLVLGLNGAPFAKEEDAKEAWIQKVCDDCNRKKGKRYAESMERAARHD